MKKLLKIKYINERFICMFFILYKTKYYTLFLQFLKLHHHHICTFFPCICMHFLRRRNSCKVWKFWFEIFYFKVLFINFLDYVYNSTFFSHHICQIIPKLFHRRIEFRIEPKYMLRVLSNYDILQIWITYYIHEYIYTTNFVYKKKCSLLFYPE